MTSNIILYDSNKSNITLKVIELQERIMKSKNDTSTRLFMVTEAYDKYNKEHYIISLTILVLSSIITFIEALRLTLIELNTNKEIDNLLYSSLILNLLLLVNGTIITILSSIIRFRNYREILEGLKDAQIQLVKYKNKYLRQYNIIKFNYVNKDLSEQDIIKISDKINLYDRLVKSINYFQFIKNRDIIKYNKNKAKFDTDIYEITTELTNNREKITKQKELEFIIINSESDIEKEKIDFKRFIEVNDINLNRDKYKVDTTHNKIILNNKFNRIKEDLRN